MALGQIVLVQGINALEVLLEQRDQAVGKQRYPVLRSFAFPHDNGTSLKDVSFLANDLPSSRQIGPAPAAVDIPSIL
jgi:hypothetical protein